MIRKVDDAFVISGGGMWLPGSYESEKAARYALSSGRNQCQRT